MTAPISTSCSQCGSTIAIHESQIGNYIVCLACENTFQVAHVGFSEENSGESQLIGDASIPAIEPEPDESGKRKRLVAKRSEGTVGRFQLLEKIGEGGFGKVYRAHDPLMEREVALKISTFETSDQKRVSRFVDEAKAAGKLHHPNIVPVFESGKAGNRYFIVSELVKGQPLSTHVGQFEDRLAAACRIVRSIGLALQYAHESGVVHRDVKPANIMLDEKQTARLMDFGLAKRLELESDRTTDGSLLGTPYYMSPEQARGEIENIGPASDQYSLGVMLYELITGKRPFQGAARKVMLDHQRESPIEPQQVNDRVDRNLAAICLKALGKSPQDRYPSTGDFAEDLGRWLNGDSVVARHATLVERGRKWCQRNRPVASLGGTILVLLLFILIGGGMFVLSLKRSEQRIIEEIGVGQSLEEAVNSLKSKVEQVNVSNTELENQLGDSNERHQVSTKESTKLNGEVKELEATILDERNYHKKKLRELKSQLEVRANQERDNAARLG